LQYRGVVGKIPRVNINVYLPDALGKRAKEANLPISLLARHAVERELERRSAMEETLSEETQLVELEFEDDGRTVIGRFRGVLVAEGHNVQAYVTDDGRVIAYDEERQRVQVLENPAEQLLTWFPYDWDEYAKAMEAIGEKPVVDL
jgi:hypothetical protein